MSRAFPATDGDVSMRIAVTRSILALILAAAGQCALAFPAAGGETPAPRRTLVVRNLTGQDLFRLYVETINPRCWCEDVLGEEVIAPGASVTIDLGDENACRYDLVAEMKDGTRISLNNADLCARHVWIVGPAAQSNLE
jgi:hypothetical protein